MRNIADAKGLMSSDKSVLFVTSQLRQREIKMASALKSIGWKVGLIYYKSTPFTPDNYFDFAWEVTSALQAYRYANELTPKVIHVFSGAIDDYVMHLCRHKIAPVVIDLNDVFSPALMDYCPERFPITKEALALADGFCARDLQVKRAQQIDHCRIPDRLLFYPEYCWNTERPLASKFDDNEIHIVSVGTISLETYGMYDCCYVELVKRIVAQGIHIHFYPPWHYRKDFKQQHGPSFEKDYADFIELQKTTPYFHIHDSLPVDKLAEQLGKFDFGIISGGCKEFGQRYSHFKPVYVEACYSGRITDYLDAGLPVIINEEVVFDYRLLKRYGVSVDLKKILHPGFKEELLRLKKSNAYKSQIPFVRKTLSISQNAHRLANFYADVMQCKIKKSILDTNVSLTKKLISYIPKKVMQVKRYWGAQ